MNKKHKIIITILSFIILSFIVLPNLKADLDTESIKNAQILADAWIIVNNSSNPKAYNLNSFISRREMLKVMLNLAWIKPDDTCEWKFSDLKPNDWWCKYAETALKLGYIAANKNFRPNDSVSKAESLKMIFKAKWISVSPTSDWRVWYMKKAVELWYSEKFFDYDSAWKRSFVFNIWAKTISKVSKVKEEIMFYEKPKVLLAFAKEMNRSSVLSNLKIYPEIAYTANWIDDKNLELVIDDLVKEDTDLLVNVLDSASTSSWEKLEKTYVKKFKIDGEPLIDFVTPSWAITDLNQSITVRFSKPMVVLTNLDNQTKCPIEIIPQIPGKCVWITTSTFQFRPEKWFPTGGKYLVNIPSWITTVAWDKTINSKSFEITTPDFALVSDITTLWADEKLNFVFNDWLSLDNFKKNFKLSSISNDNLIFSYYKWESDLEENKNIISVYPKSWDWGYQKNYTYSIFDKLTSLRWNVGLKNTISKNFTTNDFLVSYNPVVFLNESAEEKYDISNLKQSQNKDIITTSNPSILLTFYKEVRLDKNLFSSNLPFELRYVKTSNYDNWKVELLEDKKQVLITFLGDVNSSLTFKILLSKISSTSDKVLNFKTKENNSIISYKQINYKKACLETKNDIWYNNNFSAFIFDKYWKIDYMYKVDAWTRDNDCAYSAWKNRYILNTRLNPSSDYKLTIKSTFIDGDNYPLDKDYNYSFTTPKALNEDKSISIIDGRQLILVPNDVKPVSVWLKSVNLSQVSAKVCVGDLDILSPNYLKNWDCITKTIKLNNLWFKPNISVIDLEKVYGKDITKKYIILEVSKLSADKTEYETKDDYYIQKSSFVISDISATIKSAKNNILWLYNFSSWTNLTNEIEKIESYKKEAKYSIFGNYEWEKVTLDKNISFIAKSDWMYEFVESNFNTLLITLKNGQQIILDNAYNYYYANQNIYNYITTDKPVYKAWEKVQISGISRILSAKWYTINTSPVQVYVRDSQYKEILNKSVSLNSLWAFDLSFDLKSDAKLWNYIIEVWGNTLSFAVEEYEKPDFKVESKSKKDSYIFGETAKIDVVWEYYTWLPLSNWEWSYNLTSSEFYFDWGKTTWYTFWKEQNYWRWIKPVSSKLEWVYYLDNTTEKTWKFVLDNNWKTTLDIPLEDSTKDKIYTVSITLIDSNTKKSISNNTTFKAIRSKTFLGIKFDKYYYAFKDKANIWFVSVDIEGNKLANQSFNYKVYKVDYTYDENTLNFDTKETLVLEKNISTNALWILSDSFTFDKYWEYRFEISNWKYKTTKTIYVSGWDILRPIEAQNNIEVLADKDSYKVGETSKIVISSPVTWVKALVTIEKLDEVLNYKVINIDSFNKEIEVDIKKEYLPNFNVGVYIIKDIAFAKESLEKLKALRVEMLKVEQNLQTKKNIDYIPYRMYDLSIWPVLKEENLDTNLLTKLAQYRVQERELLNKILPEYYTWTKEIKVDLENIKLNSSIKLDKVSYLPWDKQKIELTITDNSWKPITWELTLSIIDQSLFVLKDNKTDIINYFYSNVWNSVQTFGNMQNLLKRIEFNIEDNIDTTQEVSTNSIKTMNLYWWVATEAATLAMDMAMDEWVSFKREKSVWWDISSQNPNATKLRTEFKDLAFYKAKVIFINWKTTLEVPALPDNLTTWVIFGFAYTADTKVGNFENTFKVQKELSLLPQIPRFFLNWDKSEVGWLVVNNTALVKEVKVSLDMTNISWTWILEKTVSVSPNSSILVTFPVEINTQELDKNSLTEISLKAISEELVDSIKLSKPIYPSKTSEYVFTNGMTQDLSYEEKVNFDDVSKNGWYLEVSLGATILTNLTKNLDKVLYFPSDDLFSRISFLRNALSLEELYKKLDKASDFENITLTDYNYKTYKVQEVINLVKNDIKNYVQVDNGLSYFKDCNKWWFRDSCSNIDITWDFLNLNIVVDGVDNKKLLEYYKKALITRIEENKKYNIETTTIADFLPIALYKDSDFISKYFKPKVELSNIEKLDYLKLYKLLWSTTNKTQEYLTDLKNAVLIEARWSLLPAEKSYSSLDNSVATAKMVQVLIDNWIWEKLLTQNLVRFLISNRNEEGNYYTYDFFEVINAINKYIEFTNELKYVSFIAKTFLNSKEIMTSTFRESNKFEVDKKTFNFEDYLVAWENSLGFEKTGNWKLYYDVWVRYYLPVSEMNSREEWITVSRNYYNYDEYKKAFKKDCIIPWWYSGFWWYCFTKKVKNIDSIKSANKWDYIVWEIEILLDKERTNVVVNDYLPAWAEILNTNFNTTSSEVKDISRQVSKSFWQSWFDLVEQKDDRVYLYAKHLNAWSYKYTYVLKANYVWNYNLKPATAELIDRPEIWGRSSWGKFEIK